MKFIPWTSFFKRRNQIIDEKSAVIAIETHSAFSIGGAVYFK